jgi:hypothetical protein
MENRASITDTRMRVIMLGANPNLHIFVNNKAVKCETKSIYNIQKVSHFVI